MDSTDNDIRPITPTTYASNLAAVALPNRNLNQRMSSTLETLHRQTLFLFKPPHKVGKSPGPFQSLRAIITSSWLNFLLVFIPVSWALHFALPQTFANRDTIIFVFSFLAIIPLTMLLSFATEELAMRVGQTLAGLFNATVGNTVELIVAIIALLKCELRVVQASLVGSILSNLLLVLGMCFFIGGLKYSEQGFGVSAIQLNSSLLTMSVIALLLPAAFHFASANSDTGLTGGSTGSEGKAILSVSHGVAVILLFIYAGNLTFQLWSNPSPKQDKDIRIIESTKYKKSLFQFFSNKRRRCKGDGTKESAGLPTVSRTDTFSSTAETLSDSILNDSENPSSISHEQITANSHMHIVDEEKQEDINEEEEVTPSMSIWMTAILLVAITVSVAITAEFLVDTIDQMTRDRHITKEFVSIILLPRFVGNSAEHVTAVTVSVKDKINLSVDAAIGSSIQIALFVIPFIVTLAWILGKPLTLLFDPYESITLFLAVLTVNYIVQDGKSNWLRGFILMSLYLILAVTFWFYPGSDPSGGLLETCH